MFDIPDLSPEACKWVIGGLLAAIVFVVGLLRYVVKWWREDKVYFQTAITRLETLLEARSHETDHKEAPRSEDARD